MELQRNGAQNGAPKNGLTPIIAANATPQKVDDTRLAIVVAYVVQEKGKATLDEMLAGCERLGVKTTKAAVKNAAEALRARQILSIGSTEGEESDHTSAYVMRRFGSYAPLEVAQGSQPILSVLFETPFALEIKALLDAAIEDGGELKPKSRQVYRDYSSFVVTAVTADGWLGSQVMSPALKRLYDNSPYKVVDKDDKKQEIGLYFDRAPDGGILITRDCIKGSFSRNFRLYGLPETIPDYCVFRPIVIHPKEALRQRVMPIQSQQGGAGLAKMEELAAGTEFVLRMKLPTTNGKQKISHEKWQAIISEWLEAPVRGLSPARGNRVGSAMLTKFEATPITFDGLSK